jgi:large subunit ribosomal protein L32
MPNLSACPECKEIKESHRVCPSCGSYDGRKVLEIVEKE